jgi:hypothetical protein
MIYLTPPKAKFEILLSNKMGKQCGAHDIRNEHKLLVRKTDLKIQQVGGQSRQVRSYVMYKPDDGKS